MPQIPPPPRPPNQQRPSSPPAYPAEAGARRAPAGAPIVVAAPPARPGFFRSLFAALGRFVMSLILIVVLAAILVGGVAALITAGGNTHMTVYRDGTTAGGRIVVLELTGSIDDDAAEYMRQAVETILDDDDLAAVVLRVDSPGGGITAADEIWYQVDRLKQSGRPVVASFGSVAASGGYYVACHSDHIFAQRTTITGSIGVIMQVITFGELLEKVGIEPVTMVAADSPQKDAANDIYRTWDQRDKEKIQPLLDSAYSIFFARVRDGRRQVIGDESALHAVADGSIFTADRAMELGLVDAIGYLDDAIDFAISAAKLPRAAQVLRIQRRISPFSLPPGLSESLGMTPTRSIGSRLAKLDADQLRMLWHELTRPRVMYLMP